MTTPDEDEAWRLIVDNYAETAEREADPPRPAGGDDEPRSERPTTEGPTEGPSWTLPRDDEQRPAPGPFLGSATPDDDKETAPPAGLDRHERQDEEARFVPPVPPPAPPMPLPRRAAWTGVFAAPLVFVLAATTGLELPRSLLPILLVGLVAGFGYLVLTMPKDPPDPWDDGSRV